MHTSSLLKRDFIKKWIKGLQICYSSNKKMDISERKKKIKLCADIALAASKNATTSWSNALICDAKKEDDNKILVDSLLGPESPFKPEKTVTQMFASCHKRVRSKRVLKKSCSIVKRMKNVSPRSSNLATYIAKRLVKKRTQVLKKLVPGGESMDEFSLIKEALDYILSLTVQVDVMRTLVNATEVLNQSNSKIVD